MLTFKLSIALKVCAARDVNRMVIPNVTLTRRVTVPLSFMPDHLELPWYDAEDGKPIVVDVNISRTSWSEPQRQLRAFTDDEVMWYPPDMFSNIRSSLVDNGWDIEMSESRFRRQ